VITVPGITETVLEIVAIPADVIGSAESIPVLLGRQCEILIGRHALSLWYLADHQATRSQHAGDFAHRGPVIRNVLEDVEVNDQIEAAVNERELDCIGAHIRPSQVEQIGSDVRDVRCQ